MIGFTDIQNSFSLVALEALRQQANYLYLPNNTYYVTQNGTGDSDGSTYANSMSVATHNTSTFLPNDLIYLSGTITSLITIPSSGDETGHITYDGNHPSYPEMVRQMTALGTGNHGIGETGMNAIDKSYITLQNLKIRDGATGIGLYSGDYSDETDTVRFSNINIYKCDIQRMLGSGVAIFGGNLVETKITDIVVGGSVENANLFWNIGVGTGSQDLSLVCVDNALVSHNTMGADVGTGTTDDRGIDGIVCFRTTNFIFEHNILGPHWDLYQADPTGQSNSAFFGYGEDGIDMKDVNHNGIIRYNTLIQNRQSGLTIQSGSYDIEVYGNYFAENIWGGLWTIKSGPSGSQPAEGWGTVRNLDVHHNIFYQNWGFGMLYNAGFDLYPAEAEFDTGIHVSNNVFVENGRTHEFVSDNGFITGLGFYNGAKNIAKNNIFMNNRPDYALYPLVQFTSRGTSTFESNQMDYNLFYDVKGIPEIWMDGVRGNWATAGTTIHDDNSIGEVNPLFVSYGTDFSLQVGSPAIGAGISIDASVDYNGDTIYSPYDIGSYNQGTEPEIWFSSVFDSITLPIKTDTHYRPYLSGVDATTGSEFPYDLPGRHIDDIGATGLEDSFNTHIYANCQDRPGCDNVPTDFVDISIQNKIGPSGGLENVLHIEKKNTPHDIDCVLSTGVTSSFSLDPYDDGDGSNRDTLSQLYMAYDLYQHLDDYSNYNLLFQTKAYNSVNSPMHKWSIYLSEVYGNPCYQMAFEHEYKGDQVNRYYPSLDAVQAGTNPQPIRDAWTRIELFVINSEGDDGVIQMAQDGVIVQEWYGRNMDNTYVDGVTYDCSGNTDPLHAGAQRIFGQYGGVGFQEIANIEFRESAPLASVLHGRTYLNSPNGMNERIWCPE